MTTLAGRKIRRYREGHKPKITRAEFGSRYDASFSTVQGWEEDGKIPRPATLARIVASGVVSHADWFLPANCPRCARAAEDAASCMVAACPVATERRSVA